VFINDNFWCNAKGGVEIGNDVLIGPNVVIHSSNHRFSDKNKLIRQQGHDNRAVVIGNNVWVGANVVIVPGVIVGEGCVIGAGSIVTKNLDSKSVYVGNPAKKIKDLSDV